MRAEGLDILSSSPFFAENSENSEAFRNAIWGISALGGLFAAFLLFANSVHRTIQKDEEIELRKIELEIISNQQEIELRN